MNGTVATSDVTNGVDPTAALLDVVGATKAYDGTVVLDAVDFVLRPGEVHALIGENGAGKSTLCKIISGAIDRDSGEMTIVSAERSGMNPVAMVYQESSLVPTMTVAQNLHLGDEPRFARLRRLNIEARQLLLSLNFHVPANVYVSQLGTAQRQMVEITRAIRQRARIVIFDEPTAALTPEEKEQLFGAIRRLTSSGTGVIFVSHALEESLEIADRITVLRDGRLQATIEARGCTRQDLVRMMVGRNVEQARVRPVQRAEIGDVVLEVDGLSMGRAVKHMSFSARAGEIVALAGLVGSGRTETALLISGALRRDRVGGGRVVVDGRRRRLRVPRQAVGAGVAYVTEDRKLNGFFETMSIDENIYMGHIASRRRMPILFKRSEMRSLGAELVDRFQVRTAGSNRRVIELSGGNQQKVVLARSLTRQPKVVIFDEPTRGVDVGSIEEIHRIIADTAQRGSAVIVISSYLPEVLSLADRVLVVRGGRVVVEFDGAEATEEKIMFAAVH
ncbi:MAG: sugar ABC transporter ATP-binding protein [Ilumatobacteraceae bacterium]